MASKAKINLIGEEPSLSELLKIEEEIKLDDYEESAGSEVDLVGLYFKEISKFPVLSIEEEKECCRKIKDAKDLKITKTSKKKATSSLNLTLLFVSLEECTNSDFILNTLSDYYKASKKDTDIKILKYLNRYQHLITKLGRRPNREELSDEFCRESDEYFDSFELSKSLSEDELLKEISVYLRYLAAFDVMINSNLRLVVSIAKTYARKFQIPILDLISEGNLGLMKAISKYDVDKGFKFSTYGIWWIKQTVSRYCCANISGFKIPEYMVKNAKQIKQEIEELEKQSGCKYSISELAEMYGVQESTMLACFTTANEDIVSLSLPVGEEGDSTLGDFVADESSSVEKEFFDKNLSEDIKFLFEGLTQKETAIIKLRFGIGTVNGRRYTLEEIGTKHKVTRERIRQVEAKVLRKMKQKATNTKKGRALRAYLD